MSNSEDKWAPAGGVDVQAKAAEYAHNKTAGMNERDRDERWEDIKDAYLNGYNDGVTDSNQ